MNQKMLKHMAILMAVGGMVSSLDNQDRSYKIEPREPVKKPCPPGCKEFTYYGHTVYALNEARAIKKCKRLANIK